MGNVNINIRLVGCHHNKSYPTDANRMAAEFVQKLRDANHSILSASVTYGGEDNIADPVVYLDDRDAIEGVPEENRRPRCAKDLDPPVEGRCAALEGSPFKFCPDPDCPMHGPNAPRVKCRLAAGHQGKCQPPLNLEPR